MTRIKSIVLIAISILGGIFLNSCNEEPTSLGYSLIKDTIGLYTITESNPAIKIKTSSYSKPSNVVNSGHLLLGKAGNKKSAIFMGFGDIPDSLGFVTESDIVDSYIIMYPQRYALGDTAGSNLLSFNIYDVKKHWEVTLKGSDVFNDEGFKGALVATPPPVHVVYKDTLDSIKINISKGLPASWFSRKAQLVANPTKFLDTIWGLGYYPNDNSTVINQISGNMPNYLKKTKMFVIYKNKNRNYGLDTIVMYTAMDKNLPLFEPVDPTTLTIRSGDAQLGKIDLKLDTIPIFAGIHLAELELTLDKSRSSNGNAVLDSSILIEYYRNGENDTIAALGYDYAVLRTGSTDKYYTSALAGVITDIVKLGGKGSLIIRPMTSTNEKGRAGTMVFFGADDPVVDRRPKLKIIYSVQSEKSKK